MSIEPDSCQTEDRTLSCEHGTLLQAWCSECDAAWQPGEVPAPRTAR